MTARQEKRALKGAVKRGLVSREAARALTEPERPDPVGLGIVPREQYLATAQARFAVLHGGCPACRGTDPYCSRLGVRYGKDGRAVSYDPAYGGELGRVTNRIRWALIARRDVSEMSEEVKARLRESSGAKRVAALVEGDLFVLNGVGCRVERAGADALHVTAWRDGKACRGSVSASQLAKAFAGGTARIVRRNGAGA